MIRGPGSGHGKECEWHMFRLKERLPNRVNLHGASPNALHREQEHFRLLAETMPDGITFIERKDINDTLRGTVQTN